MDSTRPSAQDSPAPPAASPAPATSAAVRRLSGPWPAWKIALVWLVFLAGCLLISSLKDDLRGEDRIVLQNLELGIRGDLVKELLGDGGALAGALLLFLYALAAASGARVYHFLGSFWPALPLSIYFMLGKAPSHPDVVSGKSQVIYTDFGHYGLHMAVGLIALLVLRRFLSICVERGVRLAMPKPTPPKWMIAAMLLMAALFGVVHTWNSYNRWNNYKIYATDTCIYSQMAYTASIGQFFQTPVYVTNETNMAHYGDNFNAEHFMPTMVAIFGPLYWLHAHPIWLWIVQHFSLGFCAVLLLYLGTRITGSPWLGAAVGAAFVLDRLVNRAAIEDIHPDAIEPFFLFAMLLAYHCRRPAWFAAMMALALGLKEDIGVFVALFGVWAIVDQRDLRWGAFAIVFGMGWHLGATKLIMEPLRAGEPMRVLERFAWMHVTPEHPDGVVPRSLGEMVKFFFGNLDRVWHYSMEQMRLLVPIKLMGPLFFLVLLRPSTFVILGPLTAVHFLAGGWPLGWPEQSFLTRYHGVAVAPWYFYAGLLGMQTLVNRRLVFPTSENADAAFPPDGEEAKRDPWWRLIFRWGPPAVPMWRDSYFPTIKIRSAPSAILAKSLALGILVQTFWNFKVLSEGPFGGNWDSKYSERHAHYLRAEEAYALIPEDAIVCAQNKHAPKFAHTHRLYLLPDVRPDTTHVVLDTRDHPWPLAQHEVINFTREMFTSGNWNVLNDAGYDGLIILERVHPDGSADVERNMKIFAELEEMGFKYFRDERLEAENW